MSIKSDDQFLPGIIAKYFDDYRSHGYIDYDDDNKQRCSIRFIYNNGRFFEIIQGIITYSTENKLHIHGKHHPLNPPRVTNRVVFHPSRNKREATYWGYQYDYHKAEVLLEMLTNKTLFQCLKVSSTNNIPAKPEIVWENNLQNLQSIPILKSSPLTEIKGQLITRYSFRYYDAKNCCWIDCYDPREIIID